MRGVSFAYPRAPLLLSRLDISARRGKVTAITGPSGSGKSTLLYILGLLQRPTKGAILLDGEAVSDLPDFDRSQLRCKRFGFVFQDFRLDQTRSVLDNVMEPAVYARFESRSMRVRAAQLLDEMGVTLPPHRRASEVSGGQAQRIALCRAVLLEPDVILADEPTGNLDAESAELVLSRLRLQADIGSTVVVVSHSRDVMERADLVIPLLPSGTQNAP